ncbi:hypothetical protein DES53_101807 [Roseimicrobium gellanilyticum]|uniref:Uncharacterized protein n=1 Tax=Roseimicrobium gellanilyticum TaxID=748857 RepID=A0A366HV81_9BACT|nr:hypothetical protein [Roseimicrobium gellanilyticum]RBP48007.1 hypothetical protein DES53_101807 [Roseimicrobium gellanilyticum]
MKLHRLETSPPEWLGSALEKFECQFSYPLGEGASFRVTHGRQYMAFFQAMGEAVVFVAERNAEVLGTVAVIRRTLRYPDGHEATAYYVCDLKVSRARAGGLVLPWLMHAVRDHVIQSGLAPVYGVVMNGTSRSPRQYTGRVAIPLFEPLAQIAVLRIPVEPPGGGALEFERTTLDHITAVRSSLHRAAWSTPLGSCTLRSEMPPVPVAMSQGRACGVVEDTRLGKQLILIGGGEMKSAHFSSFGFVDAISGLALIQAARAVASQQGFPALFLSVPKIECYDGLIQTLVGECGALEASATVFGAGFSKDAGGEWWINTSEI